VRSLFAACGYNQGIAIILTWLTTEPSHELGIRADESERRLPQGACTSPAVANLLCRDLDARLADAARWHGFVYSRYSDDLAISHPSPDANVRAIMTTARRIVRGQGLTINEAKTRVMRGQHRQIVTGLVVNREPHITPRVPRPDLRRFRAFLHRCETQGFAAATAEQDRDAQAYAAGYLAYVQMVNPEQAERFRRAHPWLRRPSPEAAVFAAGGMVGCSQEEPSHGRHGTGNRTVASHR
jgi:hypothetical protein